MNKELYLQPECKVFEVEMTEVIAQSSTEFNFSEERLDGILR